MIHHMASCTLNWKEQSKTMKLQQLYSYTRRAIDTWQMIDEGDKIAIGVSGGKDSLTMLYALKGLQRFYPKHFELEAITVDLGLGNFNMDAVKSLCNELNIPYTIVSTEIGPMLEWKSKFYILIYLDFMRD